MNMPPSELDNFYRFFRVSGLGHCRNGVGPWAIGQHLAGAGGGLDEESLDPDKNIIMAMVMWAEQGIAPESVLGTKYINDTKTLGVKSSRRHCRYPLRNQYDGVGDSSKPESWSCK